MELSLTEENYIKAIYTINAANDGEGASTNDLSAQLHNKAGSVTDMLKKLAEKKLINYEKYKGVVLTGKGEKAALGIIRKHRLWEVFLTDKLKFKWDEVHELAEQLEHIKSEELINRLENYLGNPRLDPHGEPIPDAHGQLNIMKAKPLAGCREGGNFRFAGVSRDSRSFLQHLDSIPLSIGDTLKLIEINKYDNTCKVKINKKDTRFLSEKVCEGILVEEKK
jgi:DtxR family Mn-dependent transcriptional regulator